MNKQELDKTLLSLSHTQFCNENDTALLIYDAEYFTKIREIFEYMAIDYDVNAHKMEDLSFDFVFAFTVNDISEFAPNTYQHLLMLQANGNDHLK